MCWQWMYRIVVIGAVMKVHFEIGAVVVRPGRWRYLRLDVAVNGTCAP